MNNNEGWIEWSGGECPVGPDTPVEFILRTGLRSVRTAGSLDWARTAVPSRGVDIMRYRVLVPRVLCEEVVDALIRVAEDVIYEMPEEEIAKSLEKAKTLIARMKGNTL